MCQYFSFRRSTLEKHGEQCGEEQGGSCHPVDLKNLELVLVSAEDVMDLCLSDKKPVSTVV